MADPSPLVSAKEMATRLGTPGLLVLDASVRLHRPAHDGDHRASSGRPGWREAHLPGARHLDLLEAFAEPATYHFARPAPERAARVLAELGLRPGGRVVAYDRYDGFWAARAWWTLRALGVPVQVLDGGIAAWTAAGGDVVSGDEPPAEPAVVAPLDLVEQPGAWVDRAAVLDVLHGRRDAALVCALAAEQFAGTAITRYARRGHIPGSLNLPARHLSGTDGRFLPPEALGAVAAATLPSRERPVVVYCGGGVSASHTALGLVLAGYRRVSVYDGSLEEWSADADLPLVVPAGA